MGKEVGRDRSEGVHMITQESRKSKYNQERKEKRGHCCFTSHHITSHHITSHHITSHQTTPHHITSHHITPHHITPHHIISHHDSLTPFPADCLHTVYCSAKYNSSFLYASASASLNLISTVCTCFLGSCSRLNPVPVYFCSTNRNK